MLIRYEFANGDISEVEVDDELGEIMKQMDKEEANARRKIKRHAAPLKEDIMLVSPAADTPDEDILTPAEALSKLTEDQRALVEALYGDDPISPLEYAKQLGVGPSAISNRLTRIRKKLEKDISRVKY